MIDKRFFQLGKILFLVFLFTICGKPSMYAETKEMTLHVGYHLWGTSSIVEIAPINDQVVKLVVLDELSSNKYVVYNTTYYYKRGQKIYRQLSNLTNSYYFFPLEQYKGVKNPSDRIITIQSFGYNYINIKIEEVSQSEQ